METPARRQYLALKSRHPDALLWFRMGDFYETFDADAEVMARDLHITLTSREFGKGNRVPMAGVPHHAATSYLRRLLSKGHRVAICEQLSEAGNGLVERDVVRVVTPGTVVEPNLLAARENNYLAALYPGREGVGLAYVDVTTGEFCVMQFGPEQTTLLADELTRLDPAECLVPDGATLPVLPACPQTPCPPRWFGAASARDRLQAHFGVVSLEGFGCAALRLATGAAGATLAYVEGADRDLARLLRGLTTETPGSTMTLDLATRRSLDLTRSARVGARTGTLLHVLDQTRTPMGGRLLRRWLGAPLLSTERLARRQDAVAALVAAPALRARLQTVMESAGDLERTAARARQGSATARDLLGVAAGLRAAHEAGALLATETLAPLSENRPPAPDALATLISRAIATDGEQRIAPGFDAELDAARSMVTDTQGTMLALERRLRESSGIRSLKVGYNKVFGYYIEVTRSNLAHVPPEFVRRQTLANAERFITEELRACEAAILRAEEGITALEDAAFARVRDAVAEVIDVVLHTAAWLARVDVLAALAQVASERRYVRPVLDDSGELFIQGGRHPVVEASLEQDTFIANDCALDVDGTRLLLITGPNMAGKSTYLRQVALIVLMAQIGSFVPAAAARIGVVDRIFSRVGASDDLAAGASTFLVEMVETAAILRHATARSLLIFDEIGRGTSTHDGVAIARAVVEDVHSRIGARTLFATHYHELIALADALPHLRNANAAAVEEGGRVVFLHRIRPGGADRSYGIHVAEIAGLPQHVTDRARALLAAAERSSSSVTQPASVLHLSAAPPPVSDAADRSRSQLVAAAQGHNPASDSEPRSHTDHVPASTAAERDTAHEPTLRDWLRGLDLARTTPLDALNLLAALQERALALDTAAPPLRLVAETQPPYRTQG